MPTRVGLKPRLQTLTYVDRDYTNAYPPRHSPGFTAAQPSIVIEKLIKASVTLRRVDYASVMAHSSRASKSQQNFTPASVVQS